jgi:ElaB/YqjD/DUF883 family membrane-anchored ribosome-binding protein
MRICYQTEKTAKNIKKMNYISLFDDFTELNESYSFESDSLIESKINQMNSLKENCMAAWDLSEFKNFFSSFINEGLSEEDSKELVEKSYCTYELGILYEHKNEWFNSPGDVHYLEDNESEVPRAILFKDNTIHIITGESLRILKEELDLLNEGWFSDIGNFLGKAKDKVKGAFNKYVKEPVKKAASWVGDKVSKAWDALSSGAKAVWEFSKKIVSAIVVFVKENPLTAIGIGLQILGSIVSFIPVAGQIISPILSVIAGGITVYEGITNILTVGKEIGNAKDVKMIVKGGAKMIFGAAELILGIKDLVIAIADAIPGAAPAGIGVKTGVIAWAKKFNKDAFSTTVAGTGAGKILGCSEWLGEFFVTLCEKAPFMKNLVTKGDNILGAGKLGKLVAKAEPGKLVAKGVDKGITKGREEVLADGRISEIDYWDGNISESDTEGWGFGELLINFMVYVGKSCFSWLYDSVVSGIGMVGKAINGLLELPNKITKGIDQFKKEHSKSFIGGIISGALSSAVRPLSSCTGKFVDQYIKPKVKPVTGWMTSLGKRNNDISAKIKSNKKLKSPVPGIKEKAPEKIPVKKIEISAKDKAAIKKIGTSGTKSLVKAGGGSEKIVAKIDKANNEFKKKFPGVSKEKGSWGQSPSGKATYTFKSKEAEGSVTLFNDGKYTVISGPNKNSRGEFKAEKGIKLIEPKDGWKKNESRKYVLSINSFM